jgi:hypothetical protein
MMDQRELIAVPIPDEDSRAMLADLNDASVEPHDHALDALCPDNVDDTRTQRDYKKYGQWIGQVR